MRKKEPAKPMLERVLENIIFLEEIFADRTDEDIPDLPFLELSKSFELKDAGAAMKLRK